MTIKIYDWDNNAVEVNLPDKEIDHIFVRVLSGDEVGTVCFTDGECVKFDASDCRYTDFFDGDYTVIGENIKKWINFTPADRRTVSYARLEMFEDD